MVGSFNSLECSGYYREEHSGNALENDIRWAWYLRVTGINRVFLIGVVKGIWNETMVCIFSEQLLKLQLRALPKFLICDSYVLTSTAHPFTITQTKASGDLRTGAAPWLPSDCLGRRTANFLLGLWGSVGKGSYDMRVNGFICSMLLTIYPHPTLFQAQVWRGWLWKRKLLWYFQLILNSFDTRV